MPHSQPYPPYQAGPFGPPPYAQPARRNRRRRIITVAGVAAVTIAVVTGFVLYSGATSGGAMTAEDALKGYFDALARGSAEDALSYAIAPPLDETFLTDEVLKKQTEKMPISDVRVVSTTSPGEVHLLATFGDVAMDERIRLKQGADGSWKLEHAAIALDFQKDDIAGTAPLLDSTTLFGQPMPASGRPYLFPGWVDIGNANRNVTTVIHRQVLPLDWDFQSGESEAEFGFELTDAGRAAAESAIFRVLQECARSSQLSPPDCPQDAARPDYIDGTANWTAPADLRDVRFGPVSPTGTMEVSGSTYFVLSVQASNPALSETNRSTWARIDGIVDVSQDPPTFVVEKG